MFVYSHAAGIQTETRYWFSNTAGTDVKRSTNDREGLLADHHGIHHCQLIVMT